MRTALRLTPLLAGAMVVLVALLASRALPTPQVLAIFIVILTAIALLEFVRSFRERANSTDATPFEAALRARAEPLPETSPFAGFESELDLSVAKAGHAHHRLLPLLRAAAATRLASRHGVELERHPDVARRLVGEEAWAFIRPDRPEPENRHVRGPRREEIAAVIARIEAL